MDVSIKISLQGGHVWEFTCDEDNPIVFGLVSALPGASLDSALPPDGLIQVESRSGERLFVTRSSLVAIEIRRLGTATAEIPAGDQVALSNPSSVPAFKLKPGFLDEAAIAALLAAARPLDETGAPGGVHELALEMLPPAILDRLVEGLETAQAARAPAAGDTHLDLRLLAAGDDVGALSPPWAGSGGSLALLLHLPLVGAGADRLAVEFADAGADATGQARTSRVVAIEPNCALLFAPDAVRSPPRVTWGAKGGRALVLGGVLRDGPGHAGG